MARKEQYDGNDESQALPAVFAGFETTIAEKSMSAMTTLNIVITRGRTIMQPAAAEI